MMSWARGKHEGYEEYAYNFDENSFGKCPLGRIRKRQ
jgi:hypothetical protein